jgi:hypothetical protein
MANAPPKGIARISYTPPACLPAPLSISRARRPSSSSTAANTTAKMANQAMGSLNKLLLDEPPIIPTGGDDDDIFG